MIIVQPPSCAAPPPRRLSATGAQPAQITPFSAQCCAASPRPCASASWEALARGGPQQPAHAKPRRTWTPDNLHREEEHWRSARQLRLRC